MIIQHNIMALNAHRQLSGNNGLVSKNLEKLSSGYRINRAGDDAAGLAISEKMRSQIKGLERAQSNAQDGISLVQTAEGALTEVHSMLNRLVDLGTESANGTIQASDRQKIQDEVDALTSEIDRISQATNFNGIKLLDGSLGGARVTSTKGTAATAGTFTFSDANKAANGLDNVSLTSGFTTGGAVTVKTEVVAAVADKAAGGINGMTGGTAGGFTSTAANGGALTGKTITIKTGTATTSAVDADGNLTITIDKTKTNSEAAFATEINTAFGAITDTGAAGTAWKATTYTAVTGGAGTWTDQSAAADDTALVTGLAMGGGSEASTKFTVSNGTEHLVATVKNSAIADGGTISLTDATDATIKASIKVATGGAALIKGGYAASGAGTQAAGTPATGGSVVISFEDQPSAGSTLEVGGQKFEFVKNAADVTLGNVGVVIGADTDATVQALHTAMAGATLTDVTVGAYDPAKPKEIAVTNTAVANLTDAPVVSQTGAGLTLQIGDTADSFNKVSVAVGDMSSTGLGINGLAVTDQGLSADSIKKVNAAVELVSTARGQLGALQNRLEHTINNLGVTTENMTAAESRIRDVDMAKEMMHFTKNNVLTQAAQAMLAQANQQPQQVLQLLR